MIGIGTPLRLLVVTTAAVAGLAVQPAHARAATASWPAYVTEFGSNSVTPIDTASNTAGTPISAGINGPHDVAISPDGHTAYVTNDTGNTVTPIDTATNSSGPLIPVGWDPLGIAVTPDGKTAYVANLGNDTVTPIDAITDTPEPAISIGVGTQPTHIAITPDGTAAWVADSGDTTVTLINTATNAVSFVIALGMPVPGSLEGIAITPDGKTAYVANNDSNTVTPIDIATRIPEPAIIVGFHPYGVAITPDGKTVYVGSQSTDTVTPIDTATNSPGIPIAINSPNSSPFGIAITPDGKTAYVATDNGQVITPIDIAANLAGAPITVGGGPFDIAITPDQAPIARVTVAAGEPGAPTTLDASASTVQYGTITSYAWDFGDGTTSTTTTATTTHVYTKIGSYTASVTETDSAGTSTTRVFTGQTVSRNGGPQASASTTVAVRPMTTTALSVSANPATAGQTVTLTATVAGAAPTGSVAFEDGGSNINGCSAQPLTNSDTATCEASTLAAGIHDITATYSGDSANAPSTSAVLVLTVAALPIPNTGAAPSAPVTWQLGLLLLALGGGVLATPRSRQPPT